MSMNKKGAAGHSWSVTPKEAIAIQNELRSKVSIAPFAEGNGKHIDEIKLIAGADVSMNMFSTEGFAGFVVMTYPDMVIVDHAVVKGELKFPYIPGLLSFREIPLLLEAWEKLKTKPDLIVVDGIGIAHPRRLGIASHLGVLLDMPTIGCAKSVLTGVYEEPAIHKGSISYLYDKKSAHTSVPEIIGAALRTKDKVKPVFISPGHKITLEESLEVISACVRKHRLPEPTRFAHETVNAYRRGESM